MAANNALSMKIHVLNHLWALARQNLSLGIPTKRVSSAAETS